MIKKTPSTPYLLKAPPDLSSHLAPILERLIEKINDQLSEYLNRVGIKTTTDDLWRDYSDGWQRERITPVDQFLELSHQLARGAKGATNPKSIAEMVFAAVTAAHYSENFIDAFDWLGRAHQTLGYGFGMLDAEFASQRSKEDSENRSQASIRGRPKVAEVKTDVLAFLESHQPASGWCKIDAIKAYSDQDIIRGSAVVQSMDADYWSDIQSNLTGWLKRDADFRQEFMKRLKAEPKAAWFNPLIS